MTYAKIIADSVSPAGIRLTTMEVRFHRFVLAEFNTHRVFSRNSASSRAIPFEKQLARVMSDPAIPVSWPAEQKGMQGGDELDPEMPEAYWLDARDEAVMIAGQMHEVGVHKSVVSRLLEPFMWHTVIVTATEWDGFFAQRCSPLAQPEIRVVAEMMQDAYHSHEPYRVWYDDWHLPYVDDDELEDWGVEKAKMVSAARCARVSYLTHDGRRDPGADLDLYDRLVTAQPPHASPLEHVARPDRVTPGSRGNFRGWAQLRHDVFPDW